MLKKYVKKIIEKLMFIVANWGSIKIQRLIANLGKERK